MTDDKEKKVDSISGKDGKTFYRSVATGTMSMDLSEREAIDRGWGWAVTMGIVMIVLGALAVVYPIVTSVGVTFLLGVVLVVAGVAQLVQAFSVRGWSGFFWHTLVAITYAVIGVLLLTYPLGGLVTLTFLLALYLLISGVFKVVISLSSREVSGWGWMLTSGILSVILGVLVWASWPVGSLWFIGLLVGIDLVLVGFSLSAMALSAHSREQEEM
ncbi:MAG: HdeD family acid-resistance protein [bacterium]|nr:HdeD family acid-resistance protein [bacterium]